jgi:release factor glutamine methyltransferase
MVTLDDLLAEARRRLAAAPLAPPGREAQLLLGRVLGWSEAQVIARGDRPVPAAAERRFRALLDRRLGGEPVAYLLGEREFYGRVFRVDNRVLVPRPETEHVVEAALALPLPEHPRILDVGTGSGCLAVTLGLEIPGARVVATDCSSAALAVASGNARRLRSPVRFAAADLAAGLDPSVFDLVVSNPPYIGRREAAGLSPEVRDFEPEVALFADDGGEAVLRRLLDLGRRLHPDAHLVLEIGYGQLDRVLERALERFDPTPWSLVGVRDDYAGIPRVVILRRDA